MGENYPHEQSLKLIRDWPHDQFVELMEFVESLWRYAEWGFSRKAGDEYHLSTGGWSGNEEIISALALNKMFWPMCWVSSRRGGHHVFKVEKIKNAKNK
jgi:hypothetical protein